MSKSLNNAIFLADEPEVVEMKVMGMYTDPKRIRADIPGEVENNPVFIYHDLFNTDLDQVQELKERYRKGKVGDVEVKRKLARAINLFLEPHRIRREYFSSQPELIVDILREGASRMRVEARETLELVRENTGLDHYHQRIADHSTSYEPAQVLSGLAFL
jgi:tryptophanyl-tRNA synthetase